MPTLRDITRRIQSVKKTAQITKAMQMVAAARLRKMQEALENARPYAQKMDTVISDLVSQSEEGAHPFMEERPGPRKLSLVVVSSDRGLCGGLNTNLFRHVQAFMKENEAQYSEITLDLIGRKARDHYKRRPVTVGNAQNQIFSSKADFQLIRPVAGELIRSFVEGEADEVVVMFTRFKSMMTQQAEALTLLPLQSVGGEGEHENEEVQAGGADYMYEPSRDGLLETLLPRYIQVRLYWLMLESLTSEFASRMTAMDSATTNAKDMIDRLTLTYNRARQAAITTELMDIVSGAEALK